MKTYNKSLLVALGLSLALPLSNLAQDTKPAKSLPTLADAVLVDIDATVQAVNPATRELTLKSPQGKVVTIKVDERVQRFDEIKVGDRILATYYTSSAVDLRAPTEEEKATPFSVVEDKARAPAGSTPAATGFRVVKAVVTIEDIDRSTRSVTFKGPHGNVATAEVKDPAALERANIGDTVVVTYTEALGIEVRFGNPPQTAPAKAK